MDLEIFQSASECQRSQNYVISSLCKKRNIYSISASYGYNNSIHLNTPDFSPLFLIGRDSFCFGSIKMYSRLTPGSSLKDNTLGGAQEIRNGANQISFIQGKHLSLQYYLTSLRVLCVLFICFGSRDQTWISHVQGKHWPAILGSYVFLWSIGGWKFWLYISISLALNLHHFFRILYNILILWNYWQKQYVNSVQ